MGYGLVLAHDSPLNNKKLSSTKAQHLLMQTPLSEVRSTNHIAKNIKNTFQFCKREEISRAACSYLNKIPLEYKQASSANHDCIRG